MQIVTGCVRSGTSCVSNIMMHLGGDFGESSALLRGNEWNPKGYFENRDVNLLNQKLLFGHWTPPELWVDQVWPKDPWIRIQKYAGLAVAPIAKSDWLIGRRAQKYAKEVLFQSQDKAGKYVKDPRFGFVMPIWEEFGQVDRVLYCFRHPMQVANSISRKTGLPSALTKTGWLDAVSSFEKHELRSKVTYLDFNRLATSDTAMDEIKILFDFMGLDFENGLASDVLDQVFEKKLLTTDVKLQALPKNYERQYQALHKLHNDQRL